MESTTENRGLRFVNYLLYCFLFLPWFLKFVIVKEQPLEGAFYNPEKPTFSAGSWFNGDFQHQQENYASAHFGLHHSFVRLKNEFDYRFFRKAHARFVVVGKNDFLFESEYLDTYYGRDFVGHRKIESNLQKLKCVQDSMQKRGQLLITVLAANKGWFYPEYFPDRFNGSKNQTNYDSYLEGLRAMKINHIDFNDYFIQQKEKSKYPLYSKYGIHWSNYGAIVAYDSLLNYIGSRVPDVSHRLVIDTVELSDSLRSPDDDILRTLNLFSDLPPIKLGYPKYHLKGDQRTEKPEMLVVADSFWWYIYSTGVAENTFRSRFWFYNEEMYPESFMRTTYVKEHNYFKAIRDADIVVIMHTGSTLYKFGNGFVDMLFETYCQKNPGKEEIQALKGAISADSTWREQVRLKASERNISLDSMLTLDAIYTIESKKNPRRK